jgi:hypothetical protein
VQGLRKGSVSQFTLDVSNEQYGSHPLLPVLPTTRLEPVHEHFNGWQLPRSEALIEMSAGWTLASASI